MIINPKLYEIDIRVLLKKQNIKLSEVPISFFRELKEKGIDIIWLMGMWSTSEHLVSKFCFTPDLTNSYTKALKNWDRTDVIGSPYAIETYHVNPRLGTDDDLMGLKEKLHNEGLKLLLDFVPNHFSVGSPYVKCNPGIFLPGDEELIQRDPFTFYKAEAGKIFAHGRDPLFPAWQDTIQVNFFNPEARDFLGDLLFDLTQFCDGVRCDMAMLPLTNVFYNTWVGPLNKMNFSKPNDEFWAGAIKRIWEKNKDFIFLAEAYWDLEWDLQEIGFDFTYDKRLTDRLAANDIAGVKAHLKADLQFQNKSVRFIENHDEQRAAFKFGKFKSLAAATLISTIPGMKFYFNGQFEGKKIKLPVQLSREPEERVSGTIKTYYDKLLSIVKEDTFIKGNWKMLEPFTAANGNITFQNFFAWEWSFNRKKQIVVINYSELTSQCRLKFDAEGETIILYDQLNDRTFERSVEEIKKIGLFIELKGFGAHIFTY